MPRFFGQADGTIFKQAVRRELCGVALNYTEIPLLLGLQYFAQEMLILSVHLQKEHNPSLDPIVLNIVETAYVFHRAAFYQNVYLYLV